MAHRAVRAMFAPLIQMTTTPPGVAHAVSGPPMIGPDS